MRTLHFCSALDRIFDEATVFKLRARVSAEETEYSFCTDWQSKGR